MSEEVPIRTLPAGTRARLRQRANQKGKSLEVEARDIIPHSYLRLSGQKRSTLSP